MTIPANILPADVTDWSVITAYRGSIAHGMFDGPHPDSVDDKDAIAIVVPSLDHYFGLREFGSKGTIEIKKDVWDVVCYTAEKTIRLLTKANPNMLSLVWLPDQLIMNATSAGQLLLENRDLFTGRWAYPAFVGYARAQMHKMTHMAGQGYMGAKRKELVARYGYDTRHASHLVRLLRMGIEFLNTGGLTVDRGGLDATQLLELKGGEWSLQQVEEEAKRLFKRADDAYDRSKLPMKPCYDAINDLAVEVVQTALEERGEITSEHCAAEAAAFRETGLAVHDRIAANGLSVKYRLHTRAI